MPRNRLLHPEQTVDEDVNALSIHARYIWAFLPCHADREGRLADKPFTLRHAILPVDDVDMDALLRELAKSGFINRYGSADGRRYIQIRTFRKHQRPHPHEAASTIPPHEPGNGSALPDQGAAAPDLGSPMSNLGSPMSDHGLPMSDHEGNGGVGPMSRQGLPMSNLVTSLPALSGSGSGSGALSLAGDPTPGPERVAPAPAPASEPQALLTGYALQEKFGRLRCEILEAGLPWDVPADPSGKASAFAEGVRGKGQTADVEPTMRLMLEHMRDEDEGWDDEKYSTNVAYAFGCWISRFPELREELHGVQPVKRAAQVKRTKLKYFDPDAQK